MNKHAKKTEGHSEITWQRGKSAKILASQPFPQIFRILFLDSQPNFFPIDNQRHHRCITDPATSINMVSFIQTFRMI